MNEQKARQILGDSINEDDSISPRYGHLYAWKIGDDKVHSGELSLDELEALAWWIRNKRDVCGTTSADWLTRAGWREYRNPASKARCFYKNYQTDTRCLGNSENDGVQVKMEVSTHNGIESFSIEIRGGLRDGTWMTITNYSLPMDIRRAVGLIPRLLSTWEDVCV